MNTKLYRYKEYIDYIEINDFSTIVGIVKHFKNMP